VGSQLLEAADQKAEISVGLAVRQPRVILLAQGCTYVHKESKIEQLSAGSGCPLVGNLLPRRELVTEFLHNSPILA